ncbi:MAG: hypothetical protein O3C05_01365 [Proteobacteria bacterium]|nr:hypothetical protein [Pseudomonadota bacterium]
MKNFRDNDIKIGRDTTETIEEKFGTPTTVINSEESILYVYIKIESIRGASRKQNIKNAESICMSFHKDTKLLYDIEDVNLDIVGNPKFETAVTHYKSPKKYGLFLKK